MKEADGSRLVGGSVNKQGTHEVRLGWLQSISTPTIRTSQVYTQACTGFSLIFSPDGLSGTLLSQDCVLKTGSSYENSGRAGTFQGQRDGKEPPTPIAQF